MTPVLGFISSPRHTLLHDELGPHLLRRALGSGEIPDDDQVASVAHPFLLGFRV